MNIPVEAKIHLNKFKPRDYQLPIFKAFFEDKYRRMVLTLPRRSGKDLCTWNIIIREAITHVGVYYYVFPTYSQGKKIIWSSVTIQGERFLDFIPRQLVDSMNSQEMKVVLTNGSIIQIIGSDSPDRIVGTNPCGVVFSEYALQNPRIYALMAPILAANRGWAIFNSTPRGKNHFWDLFQLAANSPEWWAYKIGLDETKHIDPKEIDREIEEGLMSPDLVQQEFYCSFLAGVEGSYYCKYVDKMRLNNQLGVVPWEPAFPVHTAWDIGVRDSTTIIFFQTIGQTVRIIDSYEKNKEGLEHYVKHVLSKDYTYGKHIAPHDIAVQEFGSGVTRIEKAKQLGIRFTVASKISIMDGIETVRSTLGKMWIDEEKCKVLIRALENYRQEYDSKRQVYKEQPLHDRHSHFCFAGTTKVLTAGGYCQIKNISIGDYVQTPLGFKKVLKMHRRKASELCDVRIGDELISCTPEHAFFTHRGLVRADALRYDDNIEHYTKARVRLWKKIFIYFGAESGLKGFKKSILSLKTNHKSCLMGTFIHGMANITERELLKAPLTARRLGSQRSADIFGLTIKAKFQKVLSSIISTGARRITLFSISNVSTKESIFVTTPTYLDHGQSPRPVRRLSGLLTRKLVRGIVAPKEWHGIRNTGRESKVQRESLSLRKTVCNAAKNSMLSRQRENIVAVLAKLKLDILVVSITKNARALFAGIVSSAINILQRKHVPKSVQCRQLSTPEEVYDLTIEDDNCYYVEGYLVSNCDALRYLCISLPKTRDGMSAEDLDRLRNEAMYGDQSSLPSFFRDGIQRF